jgi:hypothetical protein
MTAEKIISLLHEHGLTGDLDTLDAQILAMRDRDLGTNLVKPTGRS